MKTAKIQISTPTPFLLAVPPTRRIMKTTKSQSRPFFLDNTGSAAVLAAAVVIITSAAFTAFTGPAVPGAQLARQDEAPARGVVATVKASPVSEKMFAASSGTSPMIMVAYH